MTFEILRNRAVFCPGSNSRLRITAGSAYCAFCGSPQNAEFERGLIRERTSAGREAARKRGVRFGRPRKLTPKQENLARRLLSEGKAVRELAVAFKVHAATIYRLAYSATGMPN